MKLNREAIEKLAGEYALGTLKGGARRRFEALLHSDPDLRRAVAAWQDRLHPLGLMSDPVEPRPEVWSAIEARTVGATAARPVSAQRSESAVASPLRFWRWLGLSSSALAALMLALLVFVGLRSPAPAPEAPAWVAVLADDKAQALLVASSTTDGHVRVRLLRQPAIPADRSLELWAVPARGKPRSLGLLAQGQRELQLDRDKFPAQAPVLAISVEPAGGSTSPDGPSGPVLSTGKWLPA